MSDCNIGLKLPFTNDTPNRPDSMSAGEWGAHAEELCYNSIWVAESWGSDAFVEMAAIANKTEEIGLRTAIANVYSRTPAVLAMAGVTLQRQSDGRAALGLGASHETFIESLHGMEYAQPVRRTHETIKLIKILTSGGGTVSYDGQTVSVSDVTALDRPIPVYNGALGKANRRATGRVADGWLPYMFPLSELENGFKTIARTAREVNRDPEDISVAPQVLAAVSEDPEEAKDAIREYIIGYIGELPNYRHLLADWFPDQTAAVHEAWNADDQNAARDAISDELVAELGVAGTASAARKQLSAIAEDPIVDSPIIYVPWSASTEMRDRTIRELSPVKL